MRPGRERRKFGGTLALVLAFGAAMVLGSAGGAPAAVVCTAANTITADVVVLDNPTVFNRLGAQNPNWITYALKRDVVNSTTMVPCSEPGAGCTAGNVQLRPDKRTRPLVVRSIEGYCLDVTFTNLLDPAANPNNAQQDALINNNQVADRCAGFHATGTELVDSIDSDGSMVGANPGANIGPQIMAGQANCGTSLAAPGETRTYHLYTPHEGAYIINSYGATVGSEASGGNLGLGMFGALNVEPKGARIYRSQVTEEEMRLVTNVAIDLGEADCGTGNNPLPGHTCLGQPIIDYEAKYPNAAPWTLEGKAGLPVLNMLDGNALVHSDINAIVAGPGPNGTWGDADDGPFPASTYPLESVGKRNPALPNRLEPFREYTSVFHDEQTNTQVFPRWYGNPVLGYTLHGVGDAFMINYGSGGIGSEIISNRLHTGPMYDCSGCAYEEFFLSSSTVGDPALLVQYPANTGIEQCDPANIAAGPGDPNACWRLPNLANGPIPGNFALFQEDPTNVHHGYTGDFVKIRNIHAGAFEQHIFHLHNHQWLLNPNDDNANYLDAQEIMPGSGHTYELVNGGAGNRNKTTGDAIFHCHFYPHFAQGMWYHIRNQDVMEVGTLLAVSTPAGDKTGSNDADGDGFHDVPFALRSGQPAPGSRALADGELPDGAPIPATVPLPGKAMPPMPAKVAIVAVDRGGWSLLGGRTPPDGIPDSSQAVVDRDSVKGPDGIIGTSDDVSPGYPFFIAGYECGEIPFPAPGAMLTGGACPKGVVGQRMPTPPLDLLTEAGATAVGHNPALAGGWDGGLPRHTLLGYVSGGVTLDTQNRLDFSKIIELAQPVYYPETGTDIERASMAYHAVRDHASFANNLGGTPTAADFHLNGAPPVPGAPFQDPCIDDFGTSTGTGAQYWFDGDDDNIPEWQFPPGTESPWTSANPRTYKVANVQIDAVFNKVGYHYPQERIISLWEDVAPTVLKQRPPEPLVMRFNSGDCGKILHANLVPAEFELDDFQVRTPTDIIGQHIHLPKWDLTSNDGAANGWNYEDGTFAPGIVVERIKAINEFNHFAGSVIPAGTLPGQLAPMDLTGLAPVPTLTAAQGADPGSPALDPAVRPGADVDPTAPLVPADHPFFGPALANNPQSATYVGARTSIQRILVDPLVNVAGVDRGLGLTFSHDHYGPSTFQQIGLYSTILAEPAGSTWKHNETGVALGTRHDGGPTSWQAVIEPPAGSGVDPHREFYFEMSDFQHAYEAGVYIGADGNGLPLHTAVDQPNPFNATQATVAAGEPLATSWLQTVNPPLKLIANGGVNPGAFPDVVNAHAGCPGPLGNNDPNVPRPCAEAINISHSSMFVINYRNEPVGLRVFDPNKRGPDGRLGSQAGGLNTKNVNVNLLAGDLAFAFQSRKDRAIPALNTSLGDTPYPAVGTGDGINRDRRPGDPFTPIMRAYERDEIKVKIQTGATEEQHQASIHGVKWLSNGSGFGAAPNSGWRNFQSAGISEQFTLHTPVNPDPRQRGITVDYLYGTDVTRDGMWSGTWGILRNYGRAQGDLVQLSNNPIGASQIVNQPQFAGVCPDVDRNGIGDNLAPFDVTAVLANDVLPNNLGVTIPANAAPVDNVGGLLNTAGGTLVYNRRGTTVAVCNGVINDAGQCVDAAGAAVGLANASGPLNDPTAILYVRTSDLVVRDPSLAGCSLTDPVTGVPRLDPATGQPATDPRQLPTCPVTLADSAPVEPVVLRAKAGACIQVTLRNRLPAVAPDLAGWQDMMWVVNRQLFQPAAARDPAQMRFFNNNLVRPSSHVGLHAQLVAFDSSRDDGTIVGQNAAGSLLAPPGGAKVATFYAGDLQQNFLGTSVRGVRQFRIVATPVEFGATNLLSADRIKQPQKGLFGSLVIEPAGTLTNPTTWTEDTQVPDGQGTGSATRLTRAQATVRAPGGNAGSGGTYREALAIGHKITNLRWADGSAIKNVNQPELGREGAEDSGHAGFNYGMEPAWFRFKLPPDAPFGNAGTPNSYGSIPNAHAMYANALVATEPNAIPTIAGVSEAGDPQTPVFRATADRLGSNSRFDTRMYVLNGASADRDGAFVLHGHLWQRDPYVCTGAVNSLNSPQDDQVGLAGRCDPLAPVPSNALGLNPQGKWTAGQEGMGHVFGYWPVLFDAGGTDRVTGDYLYRDYSPSGNRNGQFGILRVQ